MRPFLVFSVILVMQVSTVESAQLSFNSLSLAEKKQVSTRLSDCARAGELVCVRQIIESGYDFLQGMEAAFLHTVWNNRVDCFDYLLSLPNLQNRIREKPASHGGMPWYTSPIDEAAKHKNHTLLARFISWDPVAVSRSGALYQCVENGDHVGIRLLLDHTETIFNSSVVAISLQKIHSENDEVRTSVDVVLSEFTRVIGARGLASLVKPWLFYDDSRESGQVSKEIAAQLVGDLLNNERFLTLIQANPEDGKAFAGAFRDFGYVEVADMLDAML